MSQPLRTAIVGAGHRAMGYARFALDHPDQMRITAVVDPDPARRAAAAERFDIPAASCFASVGELVAKSPRPADAAINGTMDTLHVPTTIPLIEAGYDVLLEKPFAVSEEETWRLADAVRRTGRKVLVCHVLRHAPFYWQIRKRLHTGILGRIFNIQLREHVSFHHFAVGFVRGKWASGEGSFLLAKSCHDVDLMIWLNAGTRPARVAAFGSRSYFRRENAPPGAGRHCLIDCPAEVENACLYSARKHYLVKPERWGFYVWEKLPREARPSLADKERALREPANPFGRCVFQLDHAVFDRHSLVVEFDNGSTATLNVVGGSAAPQRAVHIVGEKGEIFGNFEDARFTIRLINQRSDSDFDDEVVDAFASAGLDTTGASGGHGGGDGRLVADFVRVVRGNPPSLSTTSLEDSISGHLVVFAADRAALERRTVELPVAGPDPASPRDAILPPAVSAAP